MSAKPLMISQCDVRRLAITCQHLSGPRLCADQTNVMTVLRGLRYVQLDPISVVAPSHEIVLWSRLGIGVAPLLDDLLAHQRRLFEYALAAAAIVLTEDYPLYRAFMDAYPSYPELASWVEVNHGLRQHILDRLAEAGSLPTSAFEDRAVLPWKSSGWTGGRNVERMLQFLWLRGRLMVAGRLGGERVWDLAEAHLPETVGQAALPMAEAISTAVEHAARALGVACPRDIRRYFFGLNSAPPLDAAINQLRSEHRLLPVEIEGDFGPVASFIHCDTLETLEAIQADRWQGRTVLLSPFDNLISDRDRVERLWGFSFRNEMYVPKAKRQYGYYVLPILHGERLIGRVAPRLDRRRDVLEVEGLYLESDICPTSDLYRAITGQISDLATLTGVSGVEYGAIVPEAWREKLGKV